MSDANLAWFSPVERVEARLAEIQGYMILSMNKIDMRLWQFDERLDRVQHAQKEHQEKQAEQAQRAEEQTQELLTQLHVQLLQQQVEHQQQQVNQLQVQQQQVDQLHVHLQAVQALQAQHAQQQPREQQQQWCTLQVLFPEHDQILESLQSHAQILESLLKCEQQSSEKLYENESGDEGETYQHKTAHDSQWTCDRVGKSDSFEMSDDDPQQRLKQCNDDNGQQENADGETQIGPPPGPLMPLPPSPAWPRLRGRNCLRSKMRRQGLTPAEAERLSNLSSRQQPAKRHRVKRVDKQQQRDNQPNDEQEHEQDTPQQRDGQLDDGEVQTSEHWIWRQQQRDEQPDDEELQTPGHWIWRQSEWSRKICWRCQRRGHFVNTCPEPAPRQSLRSGRWI